MNSNMGYVIHQTGPRASTGRILLAHRRSDDRRATRSRFCRQAPDRRAGERRPCILPQRERRRGNRQAISCRRSARARFGIVIMIDSCLPCALHGGGRGMAGGHPLGRSHYAF